MNNRKDFGEDLKLARRILGETQEETSRRLGVGTRSITRWECGTSEPIAAHKKIIVEFIEDVLGSV